MSYNFETMMQPFFNEINKYVHWLHNLNNGVSLNVIEDFEKKYNVRLPQLYKYFLTRCNGGELFLGGVSISAIHDENIGSKVRGESYLENKDFLNSNLESRQIYRYLIIANTNYGNLFCIDLKESDDINAWIVTIEHETGEISKGLSLLEWLMYQMEIGEMLFEYNGDEKE